MVCSAYGAEGIEGARSGKHMLVATGAAEWADQVLKVLDDVRRNGFPT